MFIYVIKCLKKGVGFLNRRLGTRLIYLIRIEAGVCTECLLWIPFMYESYASRFLTSVIGIFLIFQIAVNWICIRTVSSSYNVKKYGSNGTANEAKLTESAASTSGNTSSPGRTSYPYFSWAPCLRCDSVRPPRCHHCPVCQECILKRDHHCFFVGSCVGYFNFRHYTVFLFWATIASVHVTIHMLVFYIQNVLPNTQIYDLFIPFAMLRASFGYLEWKLVFILCHCFFILAFTYWAISKFKIVVRSIRSGLTRFEMESNIKITDTRPLSGKLESIFGQYWLLNFLIPLHFLYQPRDDPLEWPYIKHPQCHNENLQLKEQN